MAPVLNTNWCRRSTDHRSNGDTVSNSISQRFITRNATSTVPRPISFSDIGYYCHCGGTERHPSLKGQDSHVRLRIPSTPSHPPQQPPPERPLPLAPSATRSSLMPPFRHWDRCPALPATAQTHAYGPPNGLAVQLGGPALDRQGARSVPSLRYDLNRTPIWNKEFIANPAERTLEGEEPPPEA